MATINATNEREEYHCMKSNNYGVVKELHKPRYTFTLSHILNNNEKNENNNIQKTSFFALPGISTSSTSPTITFLSHFQQTDYQEIVFSSIQPYSILFCSTTSYIFFLLLDIHHF